MNNKKSLPLRFANRSEIGEATQNTFLRLFSHCTEGRGQGWGTGKNKQTQKEFLLGKFKREIY